ncbi:ADP-ribose pyrophosphatase YjhB, NUDIX family [Halogranum amylolyticum]|uniref:ADP-ribose pyrophosphatase YjhB, NUDIX family n=1 Tax=Halogranum amylolyticum TaxID=660520 RepID=A0A1H8MXR4_9EURY|nr:NUDIX domain-containing protein [Halogranum amylolyticum]SEO22070.1 ADP-ribose pyrophosphatase YjhB, NUDIX family [Halogranum amylolyticum]
MVNFPPEYCPYCGTALSTVDPPTVSHCDSCDDAVFHNPTPGGSVAVVDGGGLLLVEDFRDPGGWKLPSGRFEVGETPREGAIRELEEETALSVDPAALTYCYDATVEPVEGMQLVTITFATTRAATTGTLRAGSDATDARFWRPAEFTASDQSFTETHVKRFGSDSLSWLHGVAERALADGAVSGSASASEE